jgi:hypothetical protein
MLRFPSVLQLAYSLLISMKRGRAMGHIRPVTDTASQFANGDGVRLRILYMYASSHIGYTL